MLLSCLEAQADGLAWELMDEVGPGPGFPQGGLSHLGCAPRTMLRAASLLCLLAFCCLTACSTQGQELVVVGLGLWLGEGAVPQRLAGAAVPELLAGGPFSRTALLCLVSLPAQHLPGPGKRLQALPCACGSSPHHSGKITRSVSKKC